MNGLALNMGNVLVGILIGVSGIIALFSRMDRTGESGCFYQILLTVVLGAAAVVVLGLVTS